jgi:hypothetical protein
VQAVHSGSSWYRDLRLVLFGLLAADTCYYLYAGTLAKGLDAAAWLLLLALFAVETGFAQRVRSVRVATVLSTLRLTAAIGVCVAGVGYLMAHDTLDTINTLLWIAVVVVLECEVRWPRAVARFRRTLSASAAALYAGLAMLVLIWAWRGEWFDAYDALLWLIAFATIEMDVLAGPRASAPL